MLLRRQQLLLLELQPPLPRPQLALACRQPLAEGGRLLLRLPELRLQVQPRPARLLPLLGELVAPLLPALAEQLLRVLGLDQSSIVLMGVLTHRKRLKV